MLLPSTGDDSEGQQRVESARPWQRDMDDSKSSARRPETSSQVGTDNHSHSPAAIEEEKREESGHA